MLKFILLISSAISMSGCLISMQLPTTRLESPETKGKLGSGEALLSAQTNSEIILVQDIAADAPTSGEAQISGAAGSGFKAGLGLLRRLDLYSRRSSGGGGLTIGNSPWMFGLKYQILGDPEIEANEGNISVSVLAGGGWLNETTHSNSTITGVTNADGNVAAKSFETGVLSGYRLSKYFLPYAGIFFDEAWADSRVTQSKGSSTSVYYIHSRGFEWSTALGFQTQYKLLLCRAEVAEAYVSWGPRSKFLPQFSLGLGLGW